MTEWIGLGLDVILIIVVGAGVVQAIRLIRQLQDLRAGRAEMERFVREFNGAIIRAEAGIKGLRNAARESGDDLERLVEKGTMIRDELNFIVESADGVAERLSVAASVVLNAEKANQPKVKEETKAGQGNVAVPGAGHGSAQGQGVGKAATASGGTAQKPVDPSAAGGAGTPSPASRAEKELLQALQKLS